MLQLFWSNDVFTFMFQIPIQGDILEFLLDKFACDRDSQFHGMTNYENMINYFSDVRKLSEKSRNPPESVFGGEENMEHDFVTRLNNKKDRLIKNSKHDDIMKRDVKYDSDSSVPSSFRTDR